VARGALLAAAFGAVPSAAQAPRTTGWVVKSREHVDLWLHAWATITDDTAKVPLFRRGYRDAEQVAKNQAGVVTELDANAAKLRDGLARTPALASGQFLALTFETWDQLRAAIDLALRVDGDPRAVRGADQRTVAVVSASFPGREGREWLRLFARGVDDEYARWYRERWRAVQRERAPALAAVDSLLRGRWGATLRPWFANAQAGAGDLLLSPVLGGEGRYVPGDGGAARLVAPLPAAARDAVEALYAFVHELAAAAVSPVVEDHTTPAEKRSGRADEYASHGLVVAGAYVLEALDPGLAEGYVTWYLAQAGVADAPGPALARIEAAFPLPDGLRAALREQVRTILRGI
jgi:hypothetical protein